MPFQLDRFPAHLKTIECVGGVRITYIDGTLVGFEHGAGTVVLDRHWITVPPGEEEWARDYGAKYSRKERRWYLDFLPVDEDVFGRCSPEAAYVEMKPSRGRGYGRTGRIVRTYR